ncbi:MAG: RIO1 family regulatory kinase/ATPase [Candidatus Anstonellales archaeon]
MAERWKIEELVFDKRALLTIARIMKKNIIANIDFPISTGKEAIVFRAKTKTGFAALKIYKIETTHFIKRTDYLYGDPRFKHVKKSIADIVYAFTKKEYKNLLIAEKAKINAPKAYYQEKNVIVMQFLGIDGLPFPKLAELKEVEKDYFYSIIEDIRKLYKAGLVHSDLSEFNILAGDKPYIIDFAQGVLTSHPYADVFLKKDIENIVTFFNKKANIKMGIEEALNYVKNN